jgi:hypothetical protein
MLGPLSSLAFSAFPSIFFAGFLITSFGFENPENTVVLKLLFQNFNGFFDIVITYFDFKIFKFFQVRPSFLSSVHPQTASVAQCLSWAFGLNLQSRLKSGPAVQARRSPYLLAKASASA